VFLGRFHRQKGILELLEGWKLAVEKAGDWRLALLGRSQDHVCNENSFAQSVQRRIDDLDLNGAVKIYDAEFGALREAWFRRSSAVALTSLSEGMPLTVLEAAARSLPVLISPQCNLPADRWAPASFLTEVEPTAIAKQLRRMFSTSEEELKSMGRAARNIVERRHRWDDRADDFLAVYEWLLGRRDAPAFVQFS
jgi:poly(glycerol-phosphate) alpha-glucosyltransferase